MTVEITYAPELAAGWPRNGHKHSWIASGCKWELDQIWLDGPVICGSCGHVIEREGLWRPFGSIQFWPVWSGELPGVSLSGEPTEAGGGTVPDRSRPPHLEVDRC